MRNSRLTYGLNAHQPWLNFKTLWSTRTKKKLTAISYTVRYQNMKTLTDFFRNGSFTQSKLKNRVMTCLLLGYAQNHIGGTYHILNLWKIYIGLSCIIIWINKNYGEYVSRKKNTKENSYILQDEYKSDIWTHIKMDPVNT